MDSISYLLIHNGVAKLHMLRETVLIQPFIKYILHLLY